MYISTKQMDNNFSNFQTPPNYYKRRLAAIFVFAIFFIFLGRHLTFLPTINLSMKQGGEQLKENVEKIIKNKKGFYSVYYKDLKTGELFGIDENQIETGASVNKLPIITALYLLDKKGKLSLDDKVTIQKEDVQDYGTGSIRYQKMPQVYSLRNLAKLALQQSDNTAAHVLSLRIGEENVQKLVDSWGLKQTDMVNNKTTVYDMSLLFEKIYRGEIANPANTKELLEFMTETEFEDRLTKSLPSGTKIYHKTGDGEGFVHDLGIIENGDQVYFLGVMTSDIGDQEEQTKNTIAEISKKIFESLNN
ncbi:MAG: Peptidoglycan-binding domain 1 protein [Microgenomates group bacterium GW2011_GWA2_37_6]|nr:MAG: Peptidoglycan-binding domain 1 protein [Microgenomates group bacterium GW2011_GWA2_37_6]